MPAGKTVVVVGPGSMGLLWGLLLQKGGNDVTFIDYRPGRARRFMENGITLVRGKKKESFSVKVVMPDFPFGRIDYLLVAVKSYATEKALESLKPRLASESTVISLQNGIGHIDPLLEIAGSPRLVLGATSVGANCPEEGTVVHAGDGATLLGALSESGARRVPDAVVLLENTGFDVRADDKIKARLWEKLMVNAVINPLTALHDVPNKKVGKDKNLRSLALEILDEALKVARYEGIDMDFESMKEKVFSVARETGDNISSMLQDVRAGRRTEIEAINGAIVRIAGKHRIPCPANEKILAEILDLTRPKATEDVQR